MKNKTHHKKGNTAGKYLVLSVIIIVIDQVTKYFALKGTYVKNTGILFGLAQNSNQIMIYVSIVAIAIILGVVLYAGVKHKWLYAVILGGIVGNLVDRIMHGYVVDFIDVGFWPVFNIADSAISGGVVVLLIFNFFSDQFEKNKLRRVTRELKR